MKIAKAVVAGVALVATVLTAALADDVLSITEGQALAAALVEAGAGIWAVWRVPNRTA